MTQPYYDEGGITIYHGDCREILPALGTFDLTLTDPPYGTGGKPYHGGGTRRGRTRNSRGDLRSDPPRKLAGRAVSGDSTPYDPTPDLAVAPNVILWGAHNYASRLPDSPFWLAWDRKCGKVPDGIMGDFDFAWVRGHRFKAIRAFRHMWSGICRDSEVGGGSLHPTQKPVALMAWCLTFFPEARTVVDPYMGSGPVAKACADAGLRYVGIELVEQYCERSVARLAQRQLPALARAAH